MITEAVSPENPLYKKILEETTTPIPEEVSLLVLEGIDAMLEKKGLMKCVKKFDVISYAVMSTELDIKNFWKEDWKSSGQNGNGIKEYIGWYLEPNTGERLKYCFFKLGEYLVLRKSGEILNYTKQEFNDIYKVL